jgi:twitching motility protein PilT
MAFDLGKLLDFFIENRGSDMILTVGVPPSIRLNGTIKAISKTPLQAEDTQSLVKELLKEKKQEELEAEGSTDFSMRYKGGASFRGSAFRQQGLISLVLRYLPSELITFDQLNLPNVIIDQIMRPRGLFLITGPTGSGKSSTMACLIDHLNRTAYKHIITIEDPIEFVHASQRCIVNQREVGEDVPSFSEALRRALRQDPDVILLGEMRDLETIQTALSAAETGHLVLATLHTRSASETVTRIVDAFPVDQQSSVRTQLASCLNAIICQDLLKKNSGGRVMASEVMIVNHAMRHMIRENRGHQIPSAIEIGKSEGNRLLDSHLCELYIKGDVRWEDAYERASDPTTIKARLTECRNSVEYWINLVNSKKISIQDAMKSCPEPKALQQALAQKQAKA